MGDKTLLSDLVTYGTELAQCHEQGNFAKLMQIKAWCFHGKNFVIDMMPHHINQE